jgi:hypothetical protein
VTRKLSVFVAFSIAPFQQACFPELRKQLVPNDEWGFKMGTTSKINWVLVFHQYALPGYPASHSLRLQEAGKKLYSWADEWVLEDEDKM